MTENGSERLARIETAVTTMAQTLQNTADQTSRGFETMTAMMRVLDARMSVLDNRMEEVVRQLQAIASLAHDHGEAA